MSGIDVLANQMRKEAARVGSWTATMRYALVTSYDPQNYCAKVMLQPQNVETGWLPIEANQIGNGWGIYFAPAIGDQAKIEFQEGDVEAGVITGFVFSTVDQPANVPSREMWLVHQTGASIKLTNDGKVALNSAAEIDVGNLADTVRRLVDERMVTLYNNHTHQILAVQAGSDTLVSQPPLVAMDDGELTAILKAN